MTEQDKALFLQYINPSLSTSQRAAFLQNYLNQEGIDCPIIPVEGKNHIYVSFPKSQYNPMFKIKTVIVHYDRVEGSPGANDNSFANFCMLKWAVELKKQIQPHNIRLIFTDGEELGAQGVASQGAYSLAKLFKKLSIVNDDIFVFDSIGRGTIPVVCEPSFSPSSKKFLSAYTDLENKAIKIIRDSANGRWFKLPAGLSDNAGFIANGLPAVAITMLPSEEIDLYARKLMDFRNNNFDSLKQLPDMAKYIPQTWKMFHTEKDNFENLDDRSYPVVAKILENLAQLKSLA